MNPQQDKQKKSDNTNKKDGYLNYQWSKGYVPTVNPKQDETMTFEEHYQ